MPKNGMSYSYAYTYTHADPNFHTYSHTDPNFYTYPYPDSYSYDSYIPIDNPHGSTYKPYSYITSTNASWYHYTDRHIHADIHADTNN